MSSYSVQSGSNYSGSYNENDENNENGSTEENYVTSGKSYGGDNVEGSSGKQGTSMDDIIDAAKGNQGRTGSGTLFASLGETSLDDLLQDDPSTANDDINSADYLLWNLFLHYQFGGGKDYHIDASTLDFSKTTQGDLGVDDLEIGDSREPIDLGVNDFFSKNNLAFGRITLTRISDTQFTISPNSFNFDADPSRSTSGTAATIIGDVLMNLTGQSFLWGGDFNVIFDNTVTIPR